MASNRFVVYKKEEEAKLTPEETVHTTEINLDSKGIYCVRVPDDLYDEKINFDVYRIPVRCDEDASDGSPIEITYELSGILKPNPDPKIGGQILESPKSHKKFDEVDIDVEKYRRIQNGFNEAKKFFNKKYSIEEKPQDEEFKKTPEYQAYKKLEFYESPPTEVELTKLEGLHAVIKKARTVKGLEKFDPTKKAASDAKSPPAAAPKAADAKVSPPPAAAPQPVHNVVDDEAVARRLQEEEDAKEREIAERARAKGVILFLLGPYQPVQPPPRPAAAANANANAGANIPPPAAAERSPFERLLRSKAIADAKRAAAANANASAASAAAAPDAKAVFKPYPLPPYDAKDIRQAAYFGNLEEVKAIHLTFPQDNGLLNQALVFAMAGFQRDLSRPDEELLETEAKDPDLKARRATRSILVRHLLSLSSAADPEFKINREHIPNVIMEDVMRHMKLFPNSTTISDLVVIVGSCVFSYGLRYADLNLNFDLLNTDLKRMASIMLGGLADLGNGLYYYSQVSSVLMNRLGNVFNIRLSRTNLDEVKNIEALFKRKDFYSYLVERRQLEAAANANANAAASAASASAAAAPAATNTGDQKRVEAANSLSVLQRIDRIINAPVEFWGQRRGWLLWHIMPTGVEEMRTALRTYRAGVYLSDDNATEMAILYDIAKRGVNRHLSNRYAGSDENAHAYGDFSKMDRFYRIVEVLCDPYRPDDVQDSLDSLAALEAELNLLQPQNKSASTTALKKSGPG